MQTLKWIEMEDPVVDLHISPASAAFKAIFLFFLFNKKNNLRVKTTRRKKAITVDRVWIRSSAR